MTGNSQYPVPQYTNQGNQYPYAPVPVQEPDRNQAYAPNQAYGSSDPVEQSLGPQATGFQQGYSPGKTDSAIQLGAYPQGMTGQNPVYNMPNPAYGQQHNPAYPPVQYGAQPSQQGYGVQESDQGPLGQGARLPHSHVQYPSVLYDLQHQNFAKHDPHTMVRP